MEKFLFYTVTTDFNVQEEVLAEWHKGKFQYWLSCCLALEAISTVRTNWQCACNCWPGLFSSSEDSILWFAILYHENFLCLSDLVNKHICSFLDPVSSFPQPCPAQPWALPSQTYLWASILACPHLSCLIPGTGTTCSCPTPDSAQPSGYHDGPQLPAPEVVLCPGSTCGNKSGSSSSVT